MKTKSYSRSTVLENCRVYTCWWDASARRVVTRESIFALPKYRKATRRHPSRDAAMNAAVSSLRADLLAEGYQIGSLAGPTCISVW
jgi:hypothetical protein